MVESTGNTHAPPSRLVSALPLAAALLMDAAVGVGLFLFYHAEKELGADGTWMGLLGLAAGAMFLVGCAVLGPLSDRFGRRRFVVLCGVAVTGTALAAPHVKGLPLYALLLAATTFTQGGFWPTLEAGVADSARPGRLSRRFMAFNLCWTAGFAAGALAGGYLYDLGPQPAFYTCAALAAAGAICAFVFFTARRGAAATPPAEDGRERLPEARTRRVFLLAALAFNFGCMAVNVSWRNYTRYVAIDLDLLASGSGYFSATMFAGMFLAFFPMGGRWWHYRRWPLVVGALLPLAGALLGSIGGWDAPSQRTGYAVMIAASALVGLGCGTIYAATIYYALHAPGRRAGMGALHESVIGAGSVAACMGGFLMDVKLPDFLPVVSDRIPFLTAAALALGACLLGMWILFRRRRDAATPAGPE